MLKYEWFERENVSLKVNVYHKKEVKKKNKYVAFVNMKKIIKTQK